MKTTSALSTWALAFILLAPACHAQSMNPLEHKPLAELVAALKASGHERIAQGTQNVWQQSPQANSAAKAGLPFALTMNKATAAWTVIVFHDDTEGSTLLVGDKLRSVPENEALPAFDRDKAQETIGKLSRYGATYYPDHVKNLTEQFGLRRVFSGEVAAMTAPAYEAARGYRQSEIDTHKLTLKIGGKDVEIEQGELRRIMAERVKELKEERAQLSPGQDDSGEKGGSQKAREEPDSGNAMIPVFADVLTRPDGGFMVLVVDRHGACLTVAVGDTFAERKD